MKKYLLVLILGLFMPFNAYSHCQVPCGIYGDEIRFKALAEDVQTIKKSVTEINNISKSEKKNYNQLVRWVNNKEDYANKIMNEMNNYFLAQRIKSYDSNYKEMLVAVHEIITTAMKVKQNSDAKLCDDLQEKLDYFESLYVKRNNGH